MFGKCHLEEAGDGSIVEATLLGVSEAAGQTSEETFTLAAPVATKGLGAPTSKCRKIGSFVIQIN